MEILASRILLRPKDYQHSLVFYRDVLGLAIAREYPGGTVFFAGQSLIELAAHGRPADAEGRFPVRCGCRSATFTQPRRNYAGAEWRSRAKPVRNRGPCMRCTSATRMGRL